MLKTKIFLWPLIDFHHMRQRKFQCKVRYASQMCQEVPFLSYHSEMQDSEQNSINSVQKLNDTLTARVVTHPAINHARSCLNSLLKNQSGGFFGQEVQRLELVTHIWNILYPQASNFKQRLIKSAMSASRKAILNFVLFRRVNFGLRG